MDKRYQIFISSTYADLKQERQKVIQAVMELDCIPAGMEIFPAVDEEQWKFIKRIIDDCDYYILIIGGRYGSLTSDGISYTEKEYDYAVSIGLKVLAFVHELPNNIAVDKSDSEPELQEKLKKFREKVCQGRIVKLWKQAEELPAMVTSSLAKTIKLYPATGWVRANNVASTEVLEDINKLHKENEQLRLTVAEFRKTIVDPDLKLASLDDVIQLTITYSVFANNRNYDKREPQLISWGELFAMAAPDILEHPNDATVNYKLGGCLYRRLHSGADRISQLIHDDFQTVKIQFVAMKLVELSYTATTKGGMALFWGLTNKGHNLMLQLRSIKRNKIVPIGG